MKTTDTPLSTLGDVTLGTKSYFDLPYILLFFQRVISEVPRPIATKLSHTLGSEYNFRNWVRNLGDPPLKIEGSKHENSGPDYGQLPDLTANNFGTDQDIVNRQKCVANYRHSAMCRCNLVYFAPITKKLLIVVLTFDPPDINFSNDSISGAKELCSLKNFITANG